MLAPWSNGCAFLPLGGSVKEIGNFCYIFSLTGRSKQKITKMAPLDEAERPVFSLLKGLVMDV